MVLLYTNPRGQPGEYVELLTSGQGPQPALSLEASIPLPAFGLQSAWAIDPVNGDDNAAGTPAAPLRTMAQFNARLSGNFIPQATTLQLVGDVIDSALQLAALRFAAAGTLTISGTLTDVASGLVSSSVAVGPGWQITTTGIAWLSQSVGSQVRFSTGHVAAIAELVDANNVIVGALCAPGVSISPVTPTNGSTITVATRSRALPPAINCTAQALNNAFPIILQNISFDASLGALAAFVVAGAARVQVYGCEIKDQGSFVAGGFNARGCKYTLTQTYSWQSNAAPPSTFGCVVGGTGAVLFNHQFGSTLHSSLLMTGARLTCNGALTSVTASLVHIRNTANPVLVNDGANLLCSGAAAAISGSVGNTGIGIDVALGRVAYFASNKPTVTGSSDARVNTIAKTYAQIPFTSLQLDAIPPTSTALLGNGAAFVLES